MLWTVCEVGHASRNCGRLLGCEDSLQWTASKQPGTSVLQPQGDNLPTTWGSLGKDLAPVELQMTLQLWLSPELQACEPWAEDLVKLCLNMTHRNSEMITCVVLRCSNCGNMLRSTRMNSPWKSNICGAEEKVWRLMLLFFIDLTS